MDAEKFRFLLNIIACLHHTEYPSVRVNKYVVCFAEVEVNQYC